MCIPTSSLPSTTATTAVSKLVRTMQQHADAPPSAPIAIPSVSPVNTPPQQQQKRVRFEFVLDECISPHPLDYPEPVQQSSLWYKKTDLVFFRDEARVICRNMRLRCPASSVYESCNGSDNNNRACKVQPCMSFDEETRGLESRSCLERQRRKFISGKVIVKAASSDVGDEESLAVLARKCTYWASVLAYEEALRDYALVYGNTSTSSTVTTAVTVLNNKRPATVVVDNAEVARRNVHARVR